LNESVKFYKIILIMEKFFTKIAGGSETLGKIIMLGLVIIGTFLIIAQTYSIFNKPIDQKYYYDQSNDGVDDAIDAK